jgi:hypothetical protein
VAPFIQTLTEDVQVLACLVAEETSNHYKVLLIGVPYHSKYLDGVTDTVAGEDLEGEELWEAEDLKIPVYNTEDGISSL